VGYGVAEAAGKSLALSVNYDLGVLGWCPISVASSDTTLLLPIPTRCRRVPTASRAGLESSMV